MRQLRNGSRSLGIACLVGLLATACTSGSPSSQEATSTAPSGNEETVIASPDPASDAAPGQAQAPLSNPSDSAQTQRVKVFFPKQPQAAQQPQYVEPVWRRTQDVGVAQFAIAQLLAGPSESEAQLGLEPVLALTGDSNCDGEDFQIAITARVAELQFCRQLVARDAVDMTRLTSAVAATLTQFPTVDRANVRDRQGKCLSPAGCAAPAAAAKQNAPVGLTSNARLTLTSLGPVEVGMTPTAAAAAANLRLVQEASGGEEYGCLYFMPANGPEGVSFMVIDGKIARIDIDSEQIATLSGIRIGDSEAKVREAYGDRLESQQHEYVPEGEYLIFVPTDAASQDYRVVFETDAAGTVTRMRNGLAGAALAVEGCV
ncbi:MAG: hypothetical protein HC838_06890 [Spirulinaceae cyanobacterium RM2_2_10]|nr:hypothetical protein [Spirulinaceae cyanobacterium SM2_1_0]NJO19840.1 hypothetical protein [Spirulinaceae cyanobacterium RM2_2_10]